MTWLSPSRFLLNERVWRKDSYAVHTSGLRLYSLAGQKVGLSWKRSANKGTLTTLVPSTCCAAGVYECWSILLLCTFVTTVAGSRLNRLMPRMNYMFPLSCKPKWLWLNGHSLSKFGIHQTLRIAFECPQPRLAQTFTKYSLTATWLKNRTFNFFFFFFEHILLATTSTSTPIAGNDS